MAEQTKRAVAVNCEEFERLRQARGLTLQRLASKVGVDVRTLKRWLRGQDAFIENVAAVAAVLHTTSESLLAKPNSDRMPAPVQHVTRFQLHVTMTGTIASAEQARVLAELTPTMIEQLRQLGIRVSGGASLTMEQRTDETTRQMVVIYGTLHSGDGCWIYAAVRPSMYPVFLRAIAENTCNMHEFGVFGEIVVSGSCEPPLSVLQRVHDIYQLKESVEDEWRSITQSYRAHCHAIGRPLPADRDK